MKKLFYTFTESTKGSDYSKMERIKLDVEVGQAEKLKLANHNCEDIDYRNMLEYLLKTRVNHVLENSIKLIDFCPEIAELSAFFRAFDQQRSMPNNAMQEIQKTPWLVDSIVSYLSSEEICQTLGVDQNQHIEDKLDSLGHPLFYWLLPRWLGDKVRNRLHPSLHQTFDKIRMYSRIMSGAIACLCAHTEINEKEKWQLHALSAISVTPIVVLLSVIDYEFKRLVQKQQESLSHSPSDRARQQVLSNFQAPGDLMRDVLSMEEIVKPYVLESLGLTNFNPIDYLSGYSDEKASERSIYYQARAYSFYRQLYKTGRIHTHETAIFLKQHDISKQKLVLLNKQDLADLNVQVELLKRLLNAAEAT